MTELPTALRDPSARLRHVLAIEQLDPPGDPLLVESESNDVWKIGDLFVRVCWRGDRARLERERLVATHLPEGIPYSPPLPSHAAGAGSQGPSLR